MTYDDIRPGLQTGDIVLFSGKGSISDIIKRVTACKWSHVGMVLKSEDWDMALLWESTTLSNIADLESGVPRQGVQLVPLSARLASYDGEVSIRALTTPLISSQRETLKAFRKEMTGRAYEEDKLELARSAYDGWGGGNREDLSSLFCSELVAEAFQRIGLLSEAIPSNEYTPKDFSTEARKVMNTHGPEVVIIGR